jgi:hypothetical protein
MVLLDGINTVVGSVIGAAAYTGVYDVLQQTTSLRRLVLGLTVITLVLFLPPGSRRRLAPGTAVTLLSVRDLSKAFDGNKAVSGVSSTSGRASLLRRSVPTGPANQHASTY